MNSTLTLNSIRFKPPLSKEAYIHITVQTSSTKYETLKLCYSKKQEACVYSEILPMNLNQKINSEYLIFEVIMTELVPYNRTYSLGKKTYHAAELFAKNNHSCQKTLTIELENKTEAHINIEYYPLLNIQQDLNILNLNSPSQSTSAQEKLQNWFYEVKDELNRMGDKDIDSDLKLLQLGQLYRVFIKNITPIVYLYNLLSDLIFWSKPSHTLIFGIATSIFILYPTITAAIICIIMLFNYSNLQKICLKVSYDLRHGELQVKENAPNVHLQHLRQYKINLTFIQEFMRISNDINLYCNNLLKNEDKTNLFMIIERLRAYQILIIILCFILRPEYFSLLILWTGLLRFHPGLDYIYEYFNMMWFNICQSGLGIINKNVNKVVQIQSLQHNIELQDVVQTPVRSFFIWENQRWWILLGWAKKMLPFERDNLSDAEGRISRSFVSFELPGPGWEWITPWTVEKNDKTDGDGWMYNTNDFQTLDGWQANLIALKHYIRRRRWIRTCKFKVQ